MERRPENDVIDDGELLVHPLDEVVLDHRDRQGARGGIAAHNRIVALSVAPEQGHWTLRSGLYQMTGL